MEKKEQLVTREQHQPGELERISDRRVFTPFVDVVESDADLTIHADLPGVDKKNIDVTLENRVLTIRGKAETPPHAGALAYSEYEEGDYERAFTISDEIDRDDIKATMKNGVLSLVLPKAAHLRRRQITVNSG